MNSKADEIYTLKEIAGLFGPKSYVGPWLDSNLPLIEQDIQNDIPPSPTWGELRDEKEALTVELAAVKRIRAEAEALLAKAKRDAEMAASAKKAASDAVSKAYTRLCEIWRILG